MSRQKTKKEATRELIISEALRLFKSLGYEKTTIDQIVENVNLAKGTFYYHFKSKEELLSAIMKTGANDFSETLKTEIASGISPLVILEKVVYGLCEWVETNPDALKVLLEQRFSSFLDESKNTADNGSFRTLTSSLLAVAQKENLIISDIAPMELAQMLGMMLLQAQIAYLYSNKTINIKEKFQNVLKVFIKGIKVN